MRFYYRDLIELTDLTPLTILQYMRNSLINYKKESPIQFHLDEDLVPYTTYEDLRAWLDKKSACRLYLDLCKILEDDDEIESVYKLHKISSVSYDYIQMLIKESYISLPATISEVKADLRKHPDVYMLLQIHKRDLDDHFKQREE